MSVEKRRQVPSPHPIPQEAFVPMDLTSVQGYILGERIYAHMTPADENSVVGGHVEPGKKAPTIMIFTIGVLPDSEDMGRLDDYRF